MHVRYPLKCKGASLSNIFALLALANSREQ